jgi:hypothetical protein
MTLLRSTFAIAIAILVVLPSCAMNKQWMEKNKAKQLAAAKAAAEAAKPKLYDWRGDGLQGKTAIEISLAEQKAFISIGGQDAGWTYLASGRSGFSSPTGKFTILEKTQDKYSNRWGAIVNSSGQVIDGDARAGRESIPAGGRFRGAPMPYWMRLTNYGIGMHAGPIPNPGHPASHGCIRLPAEMAEKLFSIVEIGTPVLIRSSIPQGIAAAE